MIFIIFIHANILFESDRGTSIYLQNLPTYVYISGITIIIIM